MAVTMVMPEEVKRDVPLDEFEVVHMFELFCVLLILPETGQRLNACLLGVVTRHDDVFLGLPKPAFPLLSLLSTCSFACPITCCINIF